MLKITNIIKINEQYSPFDWVLKNFTFIYVNIKKKGEHSFGEEYNTYTNLDKSIYLHNVYRIWNKWENNYRKP